MKFLILTLPLFFMSLAYASPECILFYKPKTYGIHREDTLSKIQDTEFDVLIIGGGSAGLGSALDASTRNLKTLLVEADDFASETSSKSTKLLHGGVRYLEQLWGKLLTKRQWDKTLYNLIRDALHERKAVIQNAPNLAQPLPLVTPIYSWPQVPYYWAGLKIYDLFAGQKGKLPNSYFVSGAQMKHLYPQIKSENLKGGVVYYDGQFNDARLAMSIAQTAQSKGASLINHARVIGFVKNDQGKIIGVEIRDEITGQKKTVFAKAILNATGPFADKLRKIDDPDARPMISGASGTHLVLDKQFSIPEAGILIPKTSDGRVLFVLPWEGKTLIGTTDSKSDVVEKPKTTEEDITYILSEIQNYLSEPVTRDDVKSYWTGIRPLVSDPSASDTAQLARDHVIHQNPNSGLITLTGGKWTTYRVMAEHAIDHVIRHLGRDPKVESSQTASLSLIGSKDWKKDDYKKLVSKYNLEDDVALYLHRIYGSNAGFLLEQFPSENRRIALSLPFIWSEVPYSVRFESARSITDVLARRLRVATLDKKETAIILETVGKILSKELNWSAEKLAAEIEKARIEFQI